MPGGSLTSKPTWWNVFGRSITSAFFMAVVFHGRTVRCRKSVSFVTEDRHFAPKRHGYSFEGDSLMTTATNTRRARITKLRLQNTRLPHITTGKQPITTIRASTKRRKCMPARSLA